MTASLLVIGCGEEPFTDEGEDEPQSATTYYEHVAPILNEHCAGCHYQGGLGPFPLLSYEDAANHAAAIKLETSTRSMPPFNGDNSGACNTYSNARWLTDEQIATIAAWVDGDAQPGDAAKAPPPPPAPELLVADAVATMPLAYTPIASYGAHEDYRCFIVDPGLTSNGFLTEFQVVPGEPRIVHHIGLFQAADANAETAAAGLDAQDAAAGYPCLGGPRVLARLILAAGPGQTSTQFPVGTGLKLEAGRKLIFQVHYHLAHEPLSDQTSIRMKVAPTVAKEAVVTGLGTNEIHLPPGQAEVPVSFESSLWYLSRPATIYGITPHMHTLGTRFEAELVRAGGGSTCVTQVPRWNFGWQALAVYTTPLQANPGDVVKATCYFDTRSRTTETTFGETSDDEMCALWAYVVP